MFTRGIVSITDYDRKKYSFLRDLDAYPDGEDGLFGNFPLGSRPFHLHTYIRRLCLCPVPTDCDYENMLYFYQINLPDRTVTVVDAEKNKTSICSFEEAVRRFVDPDYSEDNINLHFPAIHHIEKTINIILLPIAREFVQAAKPGVLKSSNLFSPNIAICEHRHPVRYKPFMYSPTLLNTERRLLLEDAMYNAIKVIWFQHIAQDSSEKGLFAQYGLDLLHDGVQFPYSGYSLAYDEDLPKDIAKKEIDGLLANGWS